MLSIPERYARRVAARKLALELMARHGLIGWSFDLNRQKRTLGLCRYGTKTIELSIYLVDRNDPEVVRETILHEIAHALVGPGHGHDRVWKAKAIEIGARPERCGQADMPAGRWRADCPGCGQTFSRYRKPRQMRGWSCLACGPRQGALTWKEGGS
jgi:predicted SprT family Zn-dependent metalloprotease